jgi:hypothetical protein
MAAPDVVENLLYALGGENDVATAEKAKYAENFYLGVVDGCRQLAKVAPDLAKEFTMSGVNSKGKEVQNKPYQIAHRLKAIGAT